MLEKWLERIKTNCKKYEKNVIFLENGYQIDKRTVTWEKELFDLLYPDFKNFRELYCYKRKNGNYEQDCQIDFSYEEVAYKFIYVIRENKLLDWEVFIKRKNENQFHRIFSECTLSEVRFLVEKIEKILSVLYQMSKYRVRIATGHLKIVDKNTHELFKRIKQM